MAVTSELTGTAMPSTFEQFCAESAACVLSAGTLLVVVANEKS